MPASRFSNEQNRCGRQQDQKCRGVRPAMIGRSLCLNTIIPPWINAQARYVKSDKAAHMLL
jgi:hypothetical protein